MSKPKEVELIVEKDWKIKGEVIELPSFRMVILRKKNKNEL